MSLLPYPTPQVESVLDTSLRHLPLFLCEDQQVPAAPHKPPPPIQVDSVLDPDSGGYLFEPSSLVVAIERMITAINGGGAQ